MLNNGYAQYKQTSVQTASPEKLLLMLYDGAIKFSQQAVMAIEAKNIEDSNLYIGKVQAIISEFMSTLDMQYEVSHSLMALYEYMNRRLIDANVKKDVEPLKEVMSYLSELRDTFKEASAKAKTEKQQNSGGVNFAG